MCPRDPAQPKKVYSWGWFSFQGNVVDIFPPLPTAKWNWKPWVFYIKQHRKLWSGEKKVDRHRHLNDLKNNTGEFCGFPFCSIYPRLGLEPAIWKHQQATNNSKPYGNLLSLAKGSGKGQLSNIDIIWTITTLLQPNTTKIFPKWTTTETDLISVHAKTKWGVKTQACQTVRRQLTLSPHSPTEVKDRLNKGSRTFIATEGRSPAPPSVSGMAWRIWTSTSTWQ